MYPLISHRERCKGYEGRGKVLQREGKTDPEEGRGGVSCRGERGRVLRGEAALEGVLPRHGHARWQYPGLVSIWPHLSELRPANLSPGSGGEAS